MDEAISDSTAAEIEKLAARLAGEAGAILRKYFGTSLGVEYKDEKQHDPVTVADREAQEHLAVSIAKHYPDHGFVGEEDREQEDAAAPEIVWVVDPLDGTKNFLSGLPVFACSVGVLYRGAPLVGAVHIPWLGEAAGVVLHARRGGGAYMGSDRLAVFAGVEPEGKRLSSIPRSPGSALRLNRRVRARVGDVRLTGSTVYELAMTATGALQLAMAAGPRLWDVAAGAALVMEAGGEVLVGRRRGKRTALLRPRMRWEPLGSFIPSWASGTTTMKELRDWSAPVVMGNAEVSRYLAENLVARSHIRRGLGRTLRRLTGRR